MAFVDIKMQKINDNYYDMTFENGDIVTTTGFDTALNMSVLGEKRANGSEVPDVKKRRGWWGNAFLGFDDYEIGSKLWLLSQARTTNLTANNAVTFIENSLEWLITDNYLDKVLVSAQYNDIKVLLISINLIISQDIVLSKGFKLWQNTVIEIT